MYYSTDITSNLAEEIKCWAKTNTTPTYYKLQDDDGSFVHSQIQSVIGSVVLALTSISGAWLNFLIIVALLRNSTIRKEYLTPFIISMALADFCYSVFGLPVKSLRFQYRDWPGMSCVTYTFIGLGLWTCSAWNLLGVSMIRCIAIFKHSVTSSISFKRASY